MSFHISVEIG